MSFFDQLGDMLAAKRLADSRAATFLPFIPDDQGNLPQQQQMQAPAGGFFAQLLGGLGAGPAQMAPSAAPAPSSLPAPAASPAANPFASLASAGASGQQPSPVAWDKSRQSGGVLSQLLGPQPGASAFTSPTPSTNDATGSIPASASPDVPLPPVRPSFPSSVPTRTGGMVADRGPAPNGLPTFATGAPVAVASQPDSPSNDVPMYGRSSADGLPTFAALQGAPTRQVTPNNAGGLFSGLEQRFNLPPGYLAQTAQIESGGNPNALNKGSGAAGMFQFIPSTARSVGLSNPYDVLQSSYAAAKLASDNANVLRNALGRDPTAGELYLAHQQGAAGAAKLLTNPDASAASIVGASAVKSNGGTSDMTAGQFASKWTSRFGAPGPIGAAPAGGPSVGPYGSLDPNAFGGGMPSMVAAGMPLTNATPLAPLPKASGGGPGGPRGGNVAYSANGQAVITDDQGNALGSNGQPTALAYGGVPNGAGAAPGSRAIAAVAPTLSTGDPLVTVPGYSGQWNRARIAAAPDGTDVPDDGELARAQSGSLGGATRETVQVPTRGPGTANALSPVAPQQQQPASAAAPYQAPATPAAAAPAAASPRSMQRGDYGMSITPNMIRALIANSDTQDLGIKLFETMATTKTAPIIGHAGDVILDGRTGQPIYSIPNKPDVTDAIKNYQFGQTNPGFAQYQQDQQKGEKSSYVDVPLADGRMQKMVGVPGADMSTFTPIGAPYVPKPGTSVTIDNKAESAQEGEYGKVAGQQLGEVMKAGATAPQALQQVAMLRAAAARAGDNLSTGPFGPFALKAKQALGNLAGVEIPGTSEAEVINNIGYGLATQAARAISNRPTQQEFANALSVKPGLSLSPQGMTAVLNIREQDLKDQIALAKLASVRENRTNWPAVVADYYDTHPVMSPFDPSRPLGAQDVQAINGSQQQAAPSMSAQDRNASLSAARAAIKGGASRDAVIQRLRQGGVDPSGL